MLQIYLFTPYMYRALQESVVPTFQFQPEEKEAPKAPLNNMHVKTTEQNLWDGTDIFEDMRKKILDRAPVRAAVTFKQELMSSEAAQERATSLNCGSIQIQITYVFPFFIIIIINRVLQYSGNKRKWAVGE